MIICRENYISQSQLEARFFKKIKTHMPHKNYNNLILLTVLVCQEYRRIVGVLPYPQAAQDFFET